MLFRSEIQAKALQHAGDPLVVLQIPDTNPSVKVEKLRSKSGFWVKRRLAALLEREGWRVNHERIYRLYGQQGLALRRKRRKELRRGLAPSPVPERSNQRWSMEFVSDSLASGRPFRMMTLVVTRKLTS